MTENKSPWDWSAVKDRSAWLTPCEESYYYAEKWRSEGRKSVLDLGSGLGRHALLFARYGFRVTAVDISREAVDQLKKMSRESGLDIRAVTGDMESLPFAQDAFDCIFAMHSAGHSDTGGMKRVMSEIRRVLKPGGAVFMTLCSKETDTYRQEGLPRPDENTVVKTEGPEQGVPHYFADPECIRELFSDFELIKIRHIDDCFSKGEWHLRKHYFIEAVVKKEPFVPDYSGIIGSEVSCVIDRPLGSAHPRNPDMIYPINYGYTEGIFAGDGAEQDVYIMGVNAPLETFKGRIIAVYRRFNDVEDKWIAAPEGASFTEEEILSAISFQEQFFDGELWM
ncbi:MAG: methyltransferase domain-containing protein [Ruminococcus sp.]|nr:methyltransferase domain-containing protein [Ruminococcus sp.]